MPGVPPLEAEDKEGDRSWTPRSLGDNASATGAGCYDFQGLKAELVSLQRNPFFCLENRGHKHKELGDPVHEVFVHLQ